MKNFDYFEYLPQPLMLRIGKECGGNALILFEFAFLRLNNLRLPPKRQIEFGQMGEILNIKGTPWLRITLEDMGSYLDACDKTAGVALKKLCRRGYLERKQFGIYTPDRTYYYTLGLATLKYISKNGMPQPKEDIGQIPEWISLGQPSKNNLSLPPSSDQSNKTKQSSYKNYLKRIKNFLKLLINKI